ncbi:iron-containing alcohol dehydrogenase [Microbulbifer sp. 2205BS26-8]|uniref:iron-containing alcohol dehydrogenase n=1 Tax=Microbulbifer sp. 2205BS26-8 TaxID=3064386 RepID=UPI00273E725F|nr:iron-containing alcohol dehydrogenase [Microbulbifer sp. 2205BS26-8]MDP5209161.1 iron-containing alcohol dehydrogenase [Microbulbifer sp. 2205BS26-8]
MDQYRVNWHYPTTIWVGPGRVAELASACTELRVKHPLLVTDPTLAGLPLIERVRNLCVDRGLNLEIFSAIKPNPNSENIDCGVGLLRKKNCDGVIAFGGGSAIDAGKAIALMAGQRRPIWDFEDVGDNYRRVDTNGMLPVMAVPTTAGTGSEVGRVAVITDEKAQVKRLIFHPQLLPDIVILDAELTLGLPPGITAATGMDALSHHLESYCSPMYHPMAEGIALEGMRLIKKYLPRAYTTGTDLAARQQMLVAASMGATAFQRGLGAIHALAHPLGALHNKHHGLLNAVLMPYVLVANRPAIEAPMACLARYLQLADGAPYGSGFESVLTWVLGLRKQLGIPHSLADIGIGTANADTIAQMAAVDPSATSNPISFGAEEYREIFLRACVGTVKL